MSAAQPIAAWKDAYIANLPTEVPMKALQGAVVTVAINLLDSPLSNALYGGALAALITAVEAATRPLIRSIFPKNPVIARCIQVTISQLMVLGAASAVAPWIGLTFKMRSILIPLVAWFALNGSFSKNQTWYDRNVGMASVL